MAETKEKKEKIHLTLAPEIKKAGFEYADALGVPFSAFVSMLIANYKSKKG